MTAPQLIYVLNVLTCAWVGGLAFFAPDRAQTVVFQGAFAKSESYSVIGAFWLAILICSVVGFWYPKPMAAILVVQLLYKGLWLAGFALPHLLRGEGEKVPQAMALSS